ncbi:MAG: hypothetical protein ABR507_07735 [Actinomycetota bacterium]|nr:hypothetical protein [Actinomycetota bacterium]
MRTAAKILLNILITSTLAIGFLLPWEAGAALETSIQFRFGTDSTKLTPPSGTELSGQDPWNVFVTASAPTALRSFSLRLITDDSAIPALGPGSKIDKFYPVVPTTSDSITMPWSPAVLTPYNGNYRLEAEVTSMLGDVSKVTVDNLFVNSAPNAPAGVRLTLDGTSPVVSWTANSEPDIVGYDVYRSLAGASPTNLTRVSEVALKDTSAPKGVDLTYQVAAVRKSPIGDGTITSAKTASANSVSIPLPAVVTTAVHDQLPPPPTSKQLPKGPKMLAPGTPTIKDDGRYFGTGFDETLPYGAAAAKRSGGRTVGLITSGPWEAMAAPAPSPTSSRTDKARFAAIGALLLVCALHLMSVGLKLLRAPQAT